LNKASVNLWHGIVRMRICIVRIVLLATLAWLAVSACTTLQTTLGNGETVALNQPLWQEGWSGWTPAQPAFAQDEPRVNRNVMGTAMRVAGLDFAEGVGVAGDALLVYDVAGTAESFDMLVGVDDASTNARDVARISVAVDGRERWAEERVRGQVPAHCTVALTDAHQLRIRITAPTNVYTDLALARVAGTAGLRDAMLQARSDMQDFVFQPQRALGGVACLRNGSVIYPVQHKQYGACIGLSNAQLAVVIAPNHAARIIAVSYATTDVSAIADMRVSLHPIERTIKRPPLPSADDTPWQWRFESNGTLRFLSPPDYVHGVRWSKTVFLLSDLPAARVTTMCRNCVQHDISWSIGTDVAGAPGARMVAENAQSRAAIVAPGAALWVCAAEPARGYFPYGGRRVLLPTNTAPARVTLLSEITALEPGRHLAQVVYLLPQRPGTEPFSFDACAPVYTAVTNRCARFRELPAEPTGRTIRW